VISQRPAVTASREPAITAGCVRLRRWWSGSESAPWGGQQVRQCDEVLNDISVPRPFDLSQFRAALEQARSRPLSIIAIRTRFPQLGAMWCQGATMDHILVGSAWPRLQYEHLALHGIGHMVFGHRGSPAVAQPIHSILSKSDLARLRWQPARVVYTPEEERQAEVFATRVRQLADVWTPHERADAPLALLARLSSVLEYQPQRQVRSW
jgi:hypothetical protein